MYPISNQARSISGSEASRKDRDAANSFEGDDFLKYDSIRKANSIPIDSIIRYYGTNVNKQNKKAICPFKSHKGGRENSASFYLYPKTNTFHCFGCGHGGGPVQFVSVMEQLTKDKAVLKILETFGENFDESFYELFDQKNFSEQLEVMIKFSNEIREFHKKYIDIDSYTFIENICHTYDDICFKHELSSEALQELTEKYLRKIDVYKKCHQ